MPTFVAAAGEPDLKEKLLTGYNAGGKTFKNHLDGYNFNRSSKARSPKVRVENLRISARTPT